MNFEQKIKSNMKGLFKTVLPKPFMICESEDNYFEYINYCHKLIAEIKALYLNVDFHKREFNSELMPLNKRIEDAHSIIALCYGQFRIPKGGVKYVEKAVYTSPLSHRTGR